MFQGELNASVPVTVYTDCLWDGVMYLQAPFHMRRIYREVTGRHVVPDLNVHSPVAALALRYDDVIALSSLIRASHHQTDENVWKQAQNCLRTCAKAFNRSC